MLCAQSLTHTFAGGVHALEKVSLSVQAGEFVCLLGPSGCGKSTLLRLLAGLLTPTEGRVLFEGQPLTAPTRALGFVFQKSNLLPWRTVQANVQLPLELTGVPPAEAAARAAHLLAQVGLTGFERAYPAALSGGMEQRVALARAFITQPRALLLDEPFGALDALTREKMGTELLALWEGRGVAVLMVTHDIIEAVLLADRVVVLGPRPGQVRLNLPIDLPRPRVLEMEYQPHFGALARHVRAAMLA